MNDEKIFGVKGDWIAGVVVKKLNKIPDERGAIFHMLRRDDPIFEEFGEIYFSMVYPGVIKGWHIHEKMTLNYTVICGMIKLVLYDNREDSPTKGNLMEIFMGEQNYILVKVPPLVWNGFKGIGTTPAIVANCATIPHDPEEIKRLDPFSDKIPYNWNLKHE
jgi:dTDP-4-dehydrorhamnose 3,5-epimerase